MPIKTVTCSEINKSSTPNIDTLIALTREDLDAANELIMARIQSYVTLIPELANHLISSGGKRVRPMIHSACCQLLGYEGKARLLTAASVEFLHTATLLHDDVVDESDKRRGKKTARLFWGNQATVLVGDYLLGQCFNMMVETQSQNALEGFSKASVILAEGEVFQLVCANNPLLSKEDYFKIIEAKTAALFVASCELAGVLAEQDETICKALHDFGYHLGIVFQLVDDVLDYSASHEQMGKEAGDDFREGKMTLPAIYAREAGGEKHLAFWTRCFADVNDQSETDFEKAQELILDLDVLALCQRDIDEHVKSAKEALCKLPDHPARGALLELIDFCRARKS